GKFMRRNKLVVAFAASIVVFAIVMTVQSVRTARQRDVAVLERARAEEISEFLVDLFQVPDPLTPDSGDKEVTAREILDRGARRVERELVDQPQVQAKLMSTIGETFWGLGHFDAAQEWLEKALRIQERLFDGDHVDLADSLNALAVVLRSKGERELARAMFDRVLTMRKRLLGSDHIDVAETMFNLGQSNLTQGEYDAAEEVFRQLLPIIRRLLGEGHHFVTLTMNDLALALHFKGDLEASESLYLQALARYRRLDKPHTEEAKTLGNYGALLQSKGDYEGAEQRYHEALGLFARRFGDDRYPPAGVVSSKLASLLVETGDYRGAEARSEEALDILRHRLPPSHPRVARAQSHLGAAYSGLGRFAEAEPLLLDSYRILSEESERSPHTRIVLSYLVDLYKAWKKSEEAARYLALLESIRG
ncbi:MAG: tetratricopeptide repeat protein, partial [Thermoanaerobaculia bacterium]